MQAGFVFNPLFRLISCNFSDAYWNVLPIGIGDRNEGEDKQDEGDGTVHEDSHVAIGDDQGLAEFLFHHLAENHTEDNRRSGNVDTLHEVADHSKAHHDEEILYTIVHRVYAEERKQYDETGEQILGNIEQLDPETDEGKVEYEQHDVADVH